MITISGAKTLKRIFVMSPKGGSGTTTLAFNLAGYLAATGRSVGLVDLDSQRCGARCLGKRSASLAPIRMVWTAGVRPRRFDIARIRVPIDIDHIVVDLPAGLCVRQLERLARDAAAILVPVLPAYLDTQVVTQYIDRLLAGADLRPRMGVVANRVNEMSGTYLRLTDALARSSVPLLAALRETINYTRAASSGRSIHEMPPCLAETDREQWQDLTHWLENRLLAAPARSGLIDAATAKLQPARRMRRARVRTARLVRTLGRARAAALLEMDRRRRACAASARSAAAEVAARARAARTTWDDRYARAAAAAATRRDAAVHGLRECAAAARRGGRRLAGRSEILAERLAARAQQGRGRWVGRLAAARTGAIVGLARLGGIALASAGQGLLAGVRALGRGRDAVLAVGVRVHRQVHLSMVRLCRQVREQAGRLAERSPDLPQRVAVVRMFSVGGLVALSIWIWATREPLPAPGLPIAEPVAVPALTDASRVPIPAVDEIVAAARGTLDRLQPVEVVIARLAVPDPVDTFRSKWQLSGVARVDGASVVLLSDRVAQKTHAVRDSDDLDGWTVTDAGSDFAVFSHGEAEVRLVLNEPAAARN